MLFHKFILTLSCVFALISSSWAQEGQQELMERATSGELQAQAELGAYYLYGWEGFQKNQTEGKNGF